MAKKKSVLDDVDGFFKDLDVCQKAIDLRNALEDGAEALEMEIERRLDGKDFSTYFVEFRSSGRCGAGFVPDLPLILDVDFHDGDHREAYKLSVKVVQSDLLKFEDFIQNLKLKMSKMGAARLKKNQQLNQKSKGAEIAQLKKRLNELESK